MVDDEITPTLPVGKLHYTILTQMAGLLDMPGKYNWKTLIGELPKKYSYSLPQINVISMKSQSGGSPSFALLTDFAQQLMTVGELTTYLEAINYQEALLLVKPHEPVQIICHPKSITIQAGQIVVLNCEASGFPEPSYQWFKNNVDIGKHSCDLKLNDVKEESGGNYCCKVTNKIGFEITSVAQVQVVPVCPQVVASIPGPQIPQMVKSVTPPDFKSIEQTIILYLGQAFVLTCNKPAHSYQWYRNSYPLHGACTNNLYFQSFLQADEGYYCCLINDGIEHIFTELAYLKCNEMTAEVTTNKEFATGKLALLIANQEYHNPRHSEQLVHPINDAKLLQEKLESIGFKVFSFSNLTRKEIKAAVNGFCKILTCSRELYSLFYFCGHGFEENGKTYLVPVDVDSKWTCHSAISAEEILADIQQQESTKLDVFLLDVCRTREPNGGESFGSINPPFKAGAQCVFGYATCPQSQSYEVRHHSNGIYMKHLAAHITENIQIQNLLHMVGVAVREETERWWKTSKMSPTYNSTTTKVFSLCDNILPAGFITGERDPEVEWFQYHRLPPPLTIAFDHGIKIEVKFLREPFQMSNSCNIILFVQDMGSTVHCDARCSESGVLARCLQFDSSETSVSTERSSEIERWTEVPGLQKVKDSLELTVEVEFVLDHASLPQRISQRLKFPMKEFGIVSFFDTLNHATPVAHSNPMVFLDEGLHTFHF